MGGGGFMQHASSTNRKDREQRANRRKKFKGDHADQMLQDYTGEDPIEFPEIPEEEILLERKRIEKIHGIRRKGNVLIISFTLILLIIGIYLLHLKTDGFEYW